MFNSVYLQDRLGLLFENFVDWLCEQVDCYGAGWFTALPDSELADVYLKELGEAE